MKLFHQKVFVRIGALAGIWLAASLGAAQAQSLFLMPSATTATLNGTVVFTLNLTPAAGGNNNLSLYDVNFYINSAYLKFVGATPYTQTATGTADFPDSTLGNPQTNNTTRASGDGLDPAITFPGDTNKSLRVTFDNFTDATINSTTALGTFTVQVISPLPAAGTTVTLGAADTGVAPDASHGGSELFSFFDGELLQSVGAAATLKPAPEPGAAEIFALGAALLALRGRRRSASSTPNAS